MKKLALLAVLIIGIMAIGCGKPVKQSGLTKERIENAQTEETILYEDILYEDILYENVITWDNANIQSFDD